MRSTTSRCWRCGGAPSRPAPPVCGAMPPGGKAFADAAVLGVGVPPLASGPLQLDIPADPTLLASVRNYLRTWLIEAGADEDEAYDVLVATTEAAANSVEHAY